MRCPTCQTEVPIGSGRCPRCGSVIDGATSGAVTVARPAGLNALAVLDFVVGTLVLFVAVASFGGQCGQPLPTILVTLVGGAIAVLCFAASFGIWRLRPWGRTLQLILAWMGLLGIPCVPIVSILLLRYLHRPGLRLLFSGRRAEELSGAERAELTTLRHSGTLAITVVLAYVAMIGNIVALVVIPSLLRARASANEAATIYDLRTVLAAEEAYRNANHGFYDRPGCLSAPGSCIPGYTGPSLLEAPWPNEPPWPDVRYGHQRTFHPGPTADARLAAQAHASPTSVERYAYVAVPLEGLPSNQTGDRGFCADDRGIICYTCDGAAPVVKDGRCALESCHRLE